VVSINFVFVFDACIFGREMRDNLMSKKIKINPGVGTSAFIAA
jgi:hypothetical protein